MRVIIGPQTSLGVTQVEDLGRLDAEVRGSVGTPPAEVRIDDDGEHVWVAVDWLRKTAQPAGDLDWVDRFDAMIAYAAGKNWVDDAGRHVRAHLSVQEAG